MPFATVNEVSIFFTDDGGDRPPIVLVHGWGCDGNDWIWQIPALLQSYRVITVDLRGHGRSEVAPSGYTIEGLADDVAGILRAGVARPAVVVGHSLGGIVVTVLAALHPELVSGIIVIDPAYAIQDGEPIVGIGDAARSAVSADPDSVEGRKALETLADVFPRLSTPMTPPHLKEWHRRRALGTPPAVLGATALGDGERSRWIGTGIEPLLRARVVPVLAIHRREVAATWERSLLGRRHDRVEHLQGGHWPHQEQPDVVNAILVEWLGVLLRSA